MKLPSILVTATTAALAVNGQQMFSWTEPTSNVTYKIGIPDTATTAPFDMLISMIAPVKTGWVGWAAGGCMLRSPILVAWPNGNSTIVSPRWAAAYHPPALYNGTTVKVYPSSTVNATHWTANVLCTGCSSWTGYSLDPKGNATFGWGVSSRAVGTPSSPASSIGFHDVGKSHFETEMSKTKLSAADWASLIKSFGG